MVMLKPTDNYAIINDIIMNNIFNGDQTTVVTQIKLSEIFAS